MQKRFMTMFDTQGWIGIYIVGIIFNWLISFVSTAISFVPNRDPDVYVMISLGISVLQIFITSFCYTMAYTQAVIVFINKTFLDGKKFSTNLRGTPFFFFVFSNILVCIFTLGIYIPWAYKAIIDKVAGSIESEEGGRFSFLSKTSTLLSVFIISLALIVATLMLSVLSFVVTARFGGIVAIACFSIGAVLFIGFFASVVAIQVFMVQWCINFAYNSPNKKAMYTLNINTASAIFFYMGQLILVIITFGFYMGAYMLNLYNYFVNRIEETEDGVKTGKMVFVKPINKGAGFLLLQVIICALTAGIYLPFAYVEYARFFINNTYLITRDEQKNEGNEEKVEIIEENVSLSSNA